MDKETIKRINARSRIDNEEYQRKALSGELYLEAKEELEIFTKLLEDDRDNAALKLLIDSRKETIRRADTNPEYFIKKP
ncbi:hypothetical protein SAMN05192533_102284 [Mesobacillus persicus]|uniref:IDEAL domain-containing protein n=1 Tax=Mesobacillus persicus TaxID=930146 RepID=A0A1H7XN06_9BACI|nr:hypothetical protein [Mesobacillus persicus]SEM35156.1 hypothetical protein SAMN05192533_102284 [Mesobacillus persicus]